MSSQAERTREVVGEAVAIYEEVGMMIRQSAGTNAGGSCNADREASLAVIVAIDPVELRDATRLVLDDDTDVGYRTGHRSYDIMDEIDIRRGFSGRSPAIYLGFMACTAAAGLSTAELFTDLSNLKRAGVGIVSLIVGQRIFDTERFIRWRDRRAHEAAKRSIAAPEATTY